MGQQRMPRETALLTPSKAAWNQSTVGDRSAQRVNWRLEVIVSGHQTGNLPGDLLPSSCLGHAQILSHLGYDLVAARSMDSVREDMLGDACAGIRDWGVGGRGGRKSFPENGKGTRTLFPESSPLSSEWKLGCCLLGKNNAKGKLGAKS